jgi:hypothetical protein
MRSNLIISRQFTDPGTPRMSSFSVPNVYIPFQTEREVDILAVVMMLSVHQSGVPSKLTTS